MELFLRTGTYVAEAAWGAAALQHRGHLAPVPRLKGSIFAALKASKPDWQGLPKATVQKIAKLNESFSA